MKSFVFVTLFFALIISSPVRAEEVKLKFPVLSETECKNAPSRSEFNRRLAEDGDPDQQKVIGEHYLALGNYPEAVKWVRRAAEGGQHEAQSILAVAYAPDIAMEDGGYYSGTNEGLEFAQAHVVEKSYKDAAKWYKAAADHSEYGTHVEQRILADMYQEGRGVEQDNLKAYFWARVADAMEFRAYQADEIRKVHSVQSDAIKAHLSQKQILSIDQQVEHWKPKPFRNPRFLSSFNVLGILCGYQTGWVVTDQGSQFKMRSGTDLKYWAISHSATYYLLVDKRTKKVVRQVIEGDR